MLSEIATGRGLVFGEADALRRASSFRAGREALQSEQVDRLSTGLPLPQLRLPYLFSDGIGPREVAELSEAIGRSVEALDERQLQASSKLSSPDAEARVSDKEARGGAAPPAEATFL